jgi:hypothetical protein
VKGKTETGRLVLSFIGPGFGMVRIAVDASHVTVFEGPQLFRRHSREVSFAGDAGESECAAART